MEMYIIIKRITRVIDPNYIIGISSKYGNINGYGSLLLQYRDGSSAICLMVILII